MKSILAIASLLCVLETGNLSAAVIGTNPPARPLTTARLAELPAASRPAWQQYLKRSDRQRKADQEFLKAEMRAHKIKELVVPAEARSHSILPLDRETAWYGEPEALRIAEVVISFQTPAGGWSKNLNVTGNPRAPGMHFAPDNTSRFPGQIDFDTPLDARWNYVGTFDNDATITQLHFLALVGSAAGDHGAASRAAFLRGLDYIFASQYPNGGWPQVWPLQGGYHDAITFNDNAVLNILELLRGVASGTNEFAFVPSAIRTRAAASEDRGIACILAAQIRSNGNLTVWCQQHDPLTLEPASARNYEMPSACAAESAGIMMFLMQLPNPSPAVVQSVHAAAAWFKKTEVHDVAFKRSGEDGRRLVGAPGNGPIWARYYQIESDRPIFGDRDKTIHDDVNEISRERRNGYSWYGDTAKRAMQHYAKWSRVHLQ